MSSIPAAEPPPAPKKSCRVCREEILPKALRCNKCQRYQSGWRYYGEVSTTTLATISAICSAVAAGLAWASGIIVRDSETTIAFLSATESVITITATNGGERPYIIRDIWLQFDDVPIKKAALETYRTDDGTAESNAVPATGSATINYTARGLARTVPVAQLESNVATRRESFATLIIHVQESDDTKARLTELTERIPIHRIEDFILAKAPEKEGST